MQAYQILEKYIKFFEDRGHSRIENSSLVPLNDPTTLFTSSGMQPLVPYLLGEVHPSGKRLVNAQNSFRAQDIDEIGDNRHTTFFRMLGNWSLGDYFKEEQLGWFFKFLTDKEEGIGLDPKRLYVTVFAGDKDAFIKTSDGKEIPLGLDADSIGIWKKLFKEHGLEALYVDMTNPNHTQEEIGAARIFAYGVEKNWWSRSGPPGNMPIGEIGGSDSEVFYEFTEVKHDINYGPMCHPNCDCGRFMEIGNSVFMQYKKIDKQLFEELPNKNVDFGGGLERITAASNNNPDVFQTDIYQPLVNEVVSWYIRGIFDSSINYNSSNFPLKQKIYSSVEEQENDRIQTTTSVRVITDHIKAAVFIILAGVRPSNKEQGYVLRRLLRRAAVKMHQLGGGLTPSSFSAIADSVLRIEEEIDPRIDRANSRNMVMETIDEEMDKFSKSLDRGLKEYKNFSDSQLDALNAFNLYQSHGFPFEISQELFKQRGKEINVDEYNEIYRKHKELSRTVSAKMFKGGLADHSEKTVMGHTATHLMHQALRDMFGVQLHQSGSNITSERVRFDFNFDRKLTPDELKKLEETVNQKITDNLPVHFEMIEIEKAKKMGAIGLFGDTYAKTSKIYFIGDESSSTGIPKDAYSVEFCGGPHVNFTGEVKKFTIIKQESLGKGFQRIYAHVGD